MTRTSTLHDPIGRDSVPHGGAAPPEKFARALCRALALEERLHLLGQSRRRRVAGFAAVRARKRVDAWRGRAPFDAAGAFERRLRELGVDQQGLLQALALGPARPVREHLRRQPYWEAYARLRRAAADAPAVDADTPAIAAHVDLLILVRPLVDDARAALARHIDGYDDARRTAALDVDAALAHAAAELRASLLELIQGTCLLELNVARVQGRLRGGDPRQRYVDFLRWLGSPAGRGALFAEYPVLLRLVVARIGTWLSNTGEFLDRVLADHALLPAAWFGGLAPGRLLGWQSGSGDLHRGGRSVVLARFDGGNLVYKPHGLGTDAAFAELVDWCNRHAPQRALRAVRVLDRGDYGWCEFVAGAALADAAEGADYYYRQGKFLALFYALHANDLHAENMIAAGADPVYVDMETLFHPAPLRLPQETPAAHAGWPMSVVDTMILPPRRTQGHADAYDVSALLARPEQEAPVQLMVPADLGTDHACLRPVNGVFGQSAHLPRHAGAVVGVAEHLDDLLAGFRDLYRLLLRERHALLDAPDSPLRHFAGTQARVVVRPTRLYMEFVLKSRHPEHLRDELDRRALFERLFQEPRAAAWFNRLLPAEIADLQAMDVPFFWRGFEEEGLRDARGALVPGVNFPSAQRILRAQVAGLDASDLAAQERLIRLALGGDDAPRQPPPSEELLADAGAWRRGAADIAATLQSERVERGEDRYWICQSLAAEGMLLAGAGVIDLYDGQLGVALFQGLAAAARGDELGLARAFQSFDSVRRWSDGGRRQFSTLGVFDGALGYGYVLANLAAASGDARREAELHEWFAGLDVSALGDRLDVLGGAAGAILFCAQVLEALRPAPRTAARWREGIEAFADGLVDSARAQSVGVGWPSLDPSRAAMTGFAHGNAGYAAALCVAAKVLDRRRYADLAGDALRFENAHYSAALGNWRDLRTLQDGHAEHDGAMCAWCHGAAGVLLGRALCLEAGLDGALQTLVRDDLQRAWRSLSAQAPSGNASLCHGELGNLDILLVAAPQLDDAAAREIAARARRWGEQNAPARLRCGDDRRSRLDRASASPGLMTGRAGLGYGLLRLAAPERMPSVLRLEVLRRR